MPKDWLSKLKIPVVCALVLLGAFTIVVFSGGFAPSHATEPVVVVVKKGAGLADVASILKESGLIQSRAVFELFAVLKGRAGRLKPGKYMLTGGMSAASLVDTISAGSVTDVSVTIPEGSSVREIDGILSGKGIIEVGALIKLNSDSNGKLEGFLFPDTYRLVLDSDVEDVLQKMLDNFNDKALATIQKQGPNYYDTLILASIIEKESPDSKDRKIIAGIFKKRLLAHWPLQADASLCYTKPGKCYPLAGLDYKKDSYYNTYVYRGLPPTPITNPGLDAIEATLNPEKSSYWYYLHDPKTGKAVFAETLDQQSAHKSTYLGP